MKDKDKEIRKQIIQQNKEFDKWENSIDGVLYDLTMLGDHLIDDEKDKVIIAKTLLKLPKNIKEKVLNEVVFIIGRATGSVVNFKLTKHLKDVEIKKWKFEEVQHQLISFSQSLIILNFSNMKKGGEMNTIAHEIAHFILGHGKPENISNPTNEREADNLSKKWGFKRCYKEKDYKKFEDPKRYEED